MAKEEFGKLWLEVHGRMEKMIKYEIKKPPQKVVIDDGFLQPYKKKQEKDDNKTKNKEKDK